MRNAHTHCNKNFSPPTYQLPMKAVHLRNIQVQFSEPEAAEKKQSHTLRHAHLNVQHKCMCTRP